MKAVAMVGWSGSGRFDDLRRTAIHKAARSVVGSERVGDTLLLNTDDPVALARRLAFLPGVAWVAAGYRFQGTDGYLKCLVGLGRRYLSKGRSFAISAESTRSDGSSGDLVLAGNSELLAYVEGAKVNERQPRVRFHVCMEGDRGACGTELMTGPRGAPTEGEWVSCLVSGGERSSSMAWLAALWGRSLRLVHSRADEEALRHVARLYSELSFRMDPRCLELVLLEGEGPTMGRLGSWLKENEEVAFAGLRPERARDISELAKAFPNLAFPLVLIQEEGIASAYRSLGLGRAGRGKASSGMTLKALRAGGRYSQATFGRVQADSNSVVDALKRRAA